MIATGTDVKPLDPLERDEMVQSLLPQSRESSEITDHQVHDPGELKLPRTLPLSAVQPKLSELVAGMVPGEEVVLTAQGEPVAIVTRPARTSWPSQPGTAKDRTFWMAPDFDAPLEDFAEYLE
jgi:antitoxin (DNA-binding transcriptional repressor) of toxin-antitoxin stability system